MRNLLEQVKFETLRSEIARAVNHSSLKHIKSGDQSKLGSWQAFSIFLATLLISHRERRKK